MRPIKDITNKRFGRLIAIEYDYVSKKWICDCDCGSRTKVSLTHLQDGHVKSCGCLHRAVSKSLGKNNIKHGDVGTKLYNHWRGMKSRCYYNKNKDFANYGGRGIVVCDEWKNDYLTFKNWSLTNGYQDGLTLDRINVNGNYEPSNCRWIDNISQQNNKRNNRVIKYKNNNYTISELSRVLGINYSTLWKTINKKGTDMYE